MKIQTAGIEVLAPGCREMELRLVNPFLYAGAASAWAGTTWYELLVLVALVQQRKPRRIFEFGTLDGRTTLQLAANAPGATVYTLDLPRDPTGLGSLNPLGASLSALERDIALAAQPGLYFKDTPWAERIVQLWGDSLDFDAGPYAGQMDLVFVDGAKDDGYYQMDTQNALLMAGAEGTVVWHDYANRGLFPRFDWHLEELARRETIYHIAGTFLAIRPGAGR